MSRKIVYFLETVEKATGAKKIIPDILEKMPPECDVETYYINLSGKKKADEIITENAVPIEDNADEKAAEEVIDESDSLLDTFPYNMEDQTAEISENDDEAAEESPESKTEEITPDDKAAKKTPEDKTDEITPNDEEEASNPLKFIALEDCDFSEFKDATFIVPINYLFFLLSYVSDYKDIKICPYVYDSKCIKYLFNQINKPNVAEIANMFNSTESCLFIKRGRGDDSYIWEYSLDQYGDCIIPESSYPCTAVNKKTDFDPDCIHIGWIGDISEAALSCITRICEELYKIYGEDKEGNKRDVHLFDFHVIGIGAIMGKIDFKKFCPLIRFVFPGKLQGNKLDEYICSNIDLAAGYNMNAVRGALCGVPTIIPAIDDNPVLAKRTYVYFEDAKDNYLCWTKYELHKLAFEDYKMEEVISRLTDEDTRKHDGERCFEYAFSRYSFEENAKRIAEYTDKSSLTVERLLEDPSVSRVMRQLDDYRSASEENSNATYFDYFNRNKKS